MARSSIKFEDRIGSGDVEIYTSDAIENMADVALTRGGLVLTALMVGGDYDDGLQGCGIETAHALARAGFGDALVQLTDDVPQQFLVQWCDQLVSELLVNAHHFLPSRRPSVAANMPANFPNLAVLRLYLQPMTSWTLGSGHEVEAAARSWKSREPAIHNIAHLCMTHLGWDHLDQVLQKFKSVLWGGVVMRMLCTVRL
jgi:Holliday junction resolvase YEN1